MLLKELSENFKKRTLSKKIYWSLMREKISVLREIQDLLQDNEDCKGIHIYNNSCFLEKTNGVKILFDFRQTFSRAEVNLVMGKDQEKDELEQLSRIVSKCSKKTIIDIGANIGAFSIELMQYCPDSFVFHMFEPVPDTYNCMVDMINLNNIDSRRVVLHNVGLSNKKGSFKIYLPSANGAASLKPIEDEYYLSESDEYGKYTGNKKMEEIECYFDTLDSYCENNEIRDIGFVKIDVEGNEKFVLLGAENVLKHDKPVVYCELLRKHCKRFGYHPNEVVEYMSNLGYGCYCISDNNMIEIQRIDEETEETNFIFMCK